MLFKSCAVAAFAVLGAFPEFKPPEMFQSSDSRYAHDAIVNYATDAAGIADEMADRLDRGTELELEAARKHVETASSKCRAEAWAPLNSAIDKSARSGRLGSWSSAVFRDAAKGYRQAASRKNAADKLMTSAGLVAIAYLLLRLAMFIMRKSGILHRIEAGFFRWAEQAINRSKQGLQPPPSAGSPLSPGPSSQAAAPIGTGNSTPAT